MRGLPRGLATHSRTHYFVAAIVPALIVVLSVSGFMWAQKRVTVVVDGEPVQISTHATDVSSALADAGVDIRPGDLVVPSDDAPLTQDMTVLVRHAVPVTLEIGGESIELDVVGETVADALVAAGADPSLNTAISPALEAPLRSGMTISAPESFVRIEQEETTVSPAVEERPDPTLREGQRRVVIEGSEGRVLKVFRLMVFGGLESTRALTAEHVVSQAETRVVAVGTGRAYSPVFAANPGKAPTHGRRVLVETTAYSPQQPDLDFTTATGARAQYGVIAVDPRFIPLGTRVYVPGYGYAVAADTGGAIKGARIDLCFDTVAECIRWGRRSVTIIILD